VKERQLGIGDKKPKGLLGRLGLRGAEKTAEQRPASPNPLIETANRQIDFLLKPKKWQPNEDMSHTEARSISLLSNRITLLQIRNQEKIIFRNVVDHEGLRVGWCPDDEVEPTGFQVAQAVLEGLEAAKLEMGNETT
jgi:hypothetical protein